MIWHLLGAGSLGGLWAARLARSGQSVRLILRNQERLDHYATGGAQLSLSQGQHTHSIPLSAQTTEADEPIERLILACKAYDAEAAVSSIAARLAPGAWLLALQNGLGSQQQIAQLAPQAQLICASSTEGAYSPKPFHTVFTGQGDNWLGRLDGGPAPNWLSELAAAQIPYQWSPNIADKLWRKLAINCAINPLTVLHQCRNGALREHAGPVNALISELQKLLSHYAPREAAGLAATVWQVIEATAANYSSMHQDVAARRRSEIDYLLGYACRAAHHLGLELIQLSTLNQQLRSHLRSLGLPER